MERTDLNRPVLKLRNSNGLQLNDSRIRCLLPEVPVLHYHDVDLGSRLLRLSARRCVLGRLDRSFFPQPPWLYPQLVLKRFRSTLRAGQWPKRLTKITVDSRLAVNSSAGSQF